MPPTPESPLPTAPAPLSQRLLAWGVHAFTMSGLAFATLALLAMNHDQIAWMWLWPACRPGDRTGCSWPPLRHVDCPPCLGGPVLLARGGGPGGTRHPRGQAGSRPGCASGQGRGLPGHTPS